MKVWQDFSLAKFLLIQRKFDEFAVWQTMNKIKKYTGANLQTNVLSNFCVLRYYMQVHSLSRLPVWFSIFALFLYSSQILLAPSYYKEID